MNIFKSRRHHNDLGNDGEHHENFDQTEAREAVNLSAQQKASPIDSESNDLEKYSVWVIFGMLFLLPIIFIPSLSVPFQFTKSALTFFAVFAALILFLISSLKSGRLSLPYNRILLAVWWIPIAYFISSIFSANPRLSLIGANYDLDTFSFMGLMALLVTLIVLLIRKREQVLYAYIVLFVSFIVVWVFQGLRLAFGADFMSFDVLTLSTSNILGKWNDLAIFFGLATIMTLITLASLQLSNMYKRVLYAMLLISLFFLAVVNFNLVWVIVSIFALGFFIHSIGIMRFNWKKAVPAQINEGEPVGGSTEAPVAMKTMSIPPLVVLIVSAIFLLGGNAAGNYVASQFGISQIEARPSWQTTVLVGRETYSENFLFGSGPNTFVKQWAKFKPQAINNTIFWNADFIAGIGTIPTSFVTVGLIGVISWLIFLAFYLYSGLRTLVLSPVENRFSYYVSLSSFLGGLYLWLITIFYIPNAVLLVLAFFFTGVYIGSLRHNNHARFEERTFEFANNPKIGFVSVLGLTILLLFGVIGMYSVGKQYIAAVQFQSGIMALNVAGDLDKAEQLVQNASQISGSDRYYRVLTDINISRIGLLQSETGLSEDALRQRFQLYLANAITYGQQARDYDPTNYQNWLALGRAYQSVVPLGIEGAYERAIETFDTARTFNPSNPLIPLTLARVEVARGDTLKARDHIADAIRLKSDYTDAIFLLSQIEIAEGNLDEAIRSVEAAAIIAPNNPVIFFQLGLLRYNQNDDTGAIAAFEQAVSQNNVYSNARYFLGLSYDRVGRTEDAIKQFEVIEGLNPENEEVKLILENLRAGRAPFTNATAPVLPPETRDDLPFDESNVISTEETAEVEGITEESSDDNTGLITD